MPLRFCVEEAKAGEKRCCGQDDCGDYGLPDPKDGLARRWCIGARCMAWRFVRTHINDGAGGDMVLSGDTHGYCGLAGGPSEEGAVG